MGKKGISRREFLKGTAASALGVAALGLLGGCAAENEPTVNEPCPTAESAADDWLGQEPHRSRRRCALRWSSTPPRW